MIYDTYISGRLSNYFVTNGQLSQKFLPTYSLTLGNGFKITISAFEKLLTAQHGWKTVKELQSDDVVASPVWEHLEDGYVNTQDWLGSNEDVAYILGLLTGDGANGDSIELSTGYKKHHDLIKNWCSERLSLDMSDRQRGDNNFCLRLFSGERVSSHSRKTKWHKFIEECGLKVCCYNKCVPPNIFHSNDLFRLKYLAGLWDSDGCLTQSKNEYCVCHYTSCSPHLLQQVMRLLRHFSIKHFAVPQRVYVVDILRFSQLLAEHLLVKSFSGKLTSGSQYGDWPRSDIINNIDASGLSMQQFCKDHDIARIQRKGSLFMTQMIAKKCGCQAKLDQGNSYHRVKLLEKVNDSYHFDWNIKDDFVVANGVLLKR